MLTRGGRSTLFMILLSESVGFYVTGPYLGWSDLIWYDMIWYELLGKAGEMSLAFDFIMIGKSG